MWCVALLTLLATVASGWPNPYADCQIPQPQGQQLAKCPNGTLYVSQTDPQAGYGSIQEAIIALPNDNSSQVILVGSGNYHEVVNVTRSGPTYILGMTPNPDDYAKNTVFLWNSSYINQTTQTKEQDNADAVVLTISPNRAASLVGSGPLGAPLQPDFGCVDFRMYNIDVANRATIDGVEYKDGDTGPSAALFVAYANASFYGCTFASYQDTLYVGRNGSAIFWSGEVIGSTDFIYGFGTAFFEETKLLSRNVGGGLVAWKGSTQWYGENTYGAYFNNCNIGYAKDPVPGANLSKSFLSPLARGLQSALHRALGRPWNNQSRVVYSNTYMTDIVLPAGFIEWSASDPRVFPNVTFFEESANYGPGWQPNSRNLSIESIISKKDAEQRYGLEDVFGGVPDWIDTSYISA